MVPNPALVTRTCTRISKEMTMRYFPSALLGRTEEGLLSRNSLRDVVTTLRCCPDNVTIQQGEILLHYDMIAVKSHVERQRWCFQTAEILEWPSALGEDRWYSISAKGL
jgi:hypothetical protein